MAIDLFYGHCFADLNYETTKLRNYYGEFRF